MPTTSNKRRKRNRIRSVKRSYLLGTVDFCSRKRHHVYTQTRHIYRKHAFCLRRVRVKINRPRNTPLKAGKANASYNVCERANRLDATYFSVCRLDAHKLRLICDRSLELLRRNHAIRRRGNKFVRTTAYSCENTVVLKKIGDHFARHRSEREIIRFGCACAHHELRAFCADSVGNRVFCEVKIATYAARRIVWRRRIVELFG